jgi:hypothetical protein
MSVQPIVKLTAELSASLNAVLFACTLLHDLTLISITFGDEATEEQCQLRWAEILRGVPNLRRLRITYGNLLPLFTVLPSHLPLLEHLALLISTPLDPLLLQLAHPSVRELKLFQFDVTASDEERRALEESMLHSARLPNLASISYVVLKR